jgi:hypothetical protein
MKKAQIISLLRQLALLTGVINACYQKYIIIPELSQLACDQFPAHGSEITESVDKMAISE